MTHDRRLQVCPITGKRIERRGKKEPKVAAGGDSTTRVGSVLNGKYRICSTLGRGGMSSVYEAEHLGLNRRVAIKLLHSKLARDADAVRRLRNEARVVSAIGHPNICEIFDIGETTDGRHYLVMERLVGESLAERIARRGPIEPLDLIPLLRQVLAALSAAHDKKILHRDLKPENVFIEATRDGAQLRAKLLDFGISKSMQPDYPNETRLTNPGMVMGTPYYMAPEQARGDGALDERADLWAVGVIMYEALTGKRPFDANNYNALLVKILTAQPVAITKHEPGLPPEVDRVVKRALSKLREDRYQSARDFIRELTEAGEKARNDAETRRLKEHRDHRRQRRQRREGQWARETVSEIPTAVDRVKTTEVKAVRQRVVPNRDELFKQPGSVVRAPVSTPAVPSPSQPPEPPDASPANTTLAEASETMFLSSADYEEVSVAPATWDERTDDEEPTQLYQRSWIESATKKERGNETD